MVTSTQRLSVGLVGPGGPARFHLQRLSLRTDLVPVAIVDGRPLAGESVGCRVVADYRELLDDESIDLLLIIATGAGRLETVRRAIDLGRPVAVPSPLSELEMTLVTESESPPRLLVLSNCLADDDFQAALAQVHSGRLGEPQTLAHSTWGFVGSGAAATSDAGLPPCVVDRLEQLLFLAGVDPLAVSTRHLAGAGELQGIGIAIRFSGGVTADLEYHPSSLVPLASGWVIAGTCGGYRDFELFTLTGDGEVFGTPLESPSIDLDRVYDDLIVQWDDAAYHRDVLDRAGRLVRLVAAVRGSLERGTEVAVES